MQSALPFTITNLQYFLINVLTEHKISISVTVLNIHDTVHVGKRTESQTSF